MEVTTTGPKPLGAAERPAGFSASTCCEAFQITAAERASQPALRMKGSQREWTYGDWADDVRRYAAGLHALGVRRGDTVGLLLGARPEFAVCDCAAMHLGATCFSLYITAAPEQIEYVLTDAANRVLITEQAHLERILAVRDRCPALEHVVVVDGDAPEGVLSLDELAAAGEQAAGFDFEATWRAVRPDDVLCLIYTSGTTGPPKGVELTHANIVEVWNRVYDVWPIHPGGRSISYLPNAHIADRWGTLYACYFHGSTVHCLPNPREIVAYLPEVRPTAWGGVPRIFEKLKGALQAGFAAEQDPERKRQLGEALETRLRWVRAGQAGESTAELDEAAERADAALGAPIRRMLGIDESQWCLVGAAPVPYDVLEFFAALGIPICETWGMSETSAVSTINRPDAMRFGTVGKPIPGVEVRLADDGEVLVRGPNVMRAYRNQPEKTREALDADGWLHTGDVGQLDEDGFLRIVDRKKELIINAAGKNMSPANIEEKLKSASPLLSFAVAIGDRRPYNVALLVLDPDAAAMWAQRNGVEPDVATVAADPRIHEELAAAVERANEQLSRVEQIKRFKLLPVEWLPGGDELTPTLKLKRKPIAEKYAAEIEALYAGS